MATNQSQRPKFYENQYLGADDLTAAVEYGRLQDARHVLGGHTWGIAMGLQLVEKDAAAGGGQIDVFIQPGYAWDGFGRPIVVLAPHKIPTEKFLRSNFRGMVPIWIRYDETATQSPRPGFEVCDPEDQLSRVQESFQIEVGERRDHGDQHDPIALAGRSVDAGEALQTFDSTDPLIYDESIPHQTFPEAEARARWLIPLGAVHWQPNASASPPGNFVERTEDELKFSRSLRRYIAVVAEGIQAADGVIRLRDRTKDSPALDLNDISITPENKLQIKDLVWVEGNLRVNADAKLFGGKLDFRAGNGGQNNGPLTMQRDGNDLQIVIGQRENGDCSLVVGPKLNPETPTPEFRSKLVVKNDGKAGIGVANPEHNLQIGDASAPVSLSLRGPDLNVASSVLTFEDDGGAGQRWFKLSYDTQNNRLKISSANREPIVVFERITGNLGVGLAAPTEKLHVAGGRIRLENAGKRLDMRADGGEVDLHSETNNLYLRSSGPGGKNKVIINPFGADGNVGIGTETPTTKLEVAGGDLKVQGGNIFLGATKIPVDVVVGEFFLNRLGAGSGTTNLALTSRLSNVSSGEIVVALSHIGNISVATNARWKVTYVPPAVRLSANSFRFRLDWQVDDSDGYFTAFSYVAIFLP